MGVLFNLLPPIETRRPARMDAAVPSFSLDRDAPPEVRFWAWREAVSPLFDVALASPQALEGFDARLTLWNYGPLIVGDARSVPQVIRRSPTTVAGSGTGHYLVQLHLVGSSLATVADSSIPLQAGDISVLDLSRPFRLATDALETLFLILPRRSLLASARAPSLWHGLRVCRNEPRNAMLTAHMRSLLDHGTASPEEAELAGRAGLVAIGAYLEASAQGQERHRTGKASPLLEAMCGFIDAHLADPELDAERLAGQFNVSRATLYRTFQAVGGVAEYIRDRRLKRAFVELTTSRNRGRRIADIGYDWGFPNGAAFSRSFKDAFGLSPVEARRAAASKPAPSRAGAGAPVEPVLRRWMAELA